MSERIPLSEIDTTCPQTRKSLDRIVDATDATEPSDIQQRSFPIELLPQYRPSLDEREFTETLIEAGSLLEHTTPYRQGPFYPLFERFMRELQDNLTNIDPRLTPEHLAAYGYQSDAARDVIGTLDGQQLTVLNRLAQWRLDSLDSVADQIAPAMDGQIIHPAILDTPPFYPSMDDWRKEQSEKGCSNACFRMIFSALTGQSLSQTALSEQLLQTYGTSVVHDEVLTNLFKTELFQQTYGKQVSTVEYLGMDLDHIQKVATVIKQRRPESQVFCMVNMSSAAATARTWHSAILLGADEQRVAYHDPSPTHGGAYASTDREDFLHRWAKTYNRTKFVIAS